MACDRVGFLVSKWLGSSDIVAVILHKLPEGLRSLVVWQEPIASAMRFRAGGLLGQLPLGRARASLRRS